MLAADPAGSKLQLEMIRATASFDGPPVRFKFTVSGLAIYLDNFALIGLAKNDPLRRDRFMSVLHKGADLLFSVSNAVELTGPQGKSLEAVRSFLDDVGPHWFPVELDATEVVNRELVGTPSPASFMCKRFVQDYFAFQIAQCEPNTGRIISLSQDALGLGPLLDWVVPQRESIRKGSADLMRLSLIRSLNIETNSREIRSGWMRDSRHCRSIRRDLRFLHTPTFCGL